MMFEHVSYNKVNYTPFDNWGINKETLTRYSFDLKFPMSNNNKKRTLCDLEADVLMTSRLLRECRRWPPSCRSACTAWPTIQYGYITHSSRSDLVNLSPPPEQ